MKWETDTPYIKLLLFHHLFFLSFILQSLRFSSVRQLLRSVYHGRKGIDSSTVHLLDIALQHSEERGEFVKFFTEVVKVAHTFPNNLFDLALYSLSNGRDRQNEDCTSIRKQVRARLQRHFLGFRQQLYQAGARLSRGFQETTAIAKR
jgi:hypothetical protein